MAIQVRRGFFINLDPNKLLTGEFAVSTDKQVVHIAFAPGVVKRLSTYEDMKADMQESLEDIIDNLTVSIKQATDNANNKANLAEQKAMLADAKAILADQKAQQAQAIIDSAAPIINTNLQASYADKATALTGTFITCHVADSGLAPVNKIVGETVQKVTVQGKNLYNKTKGLLINSYFNPTVAVITESGQARSIYIPCLPNTTYTISKIQSARFGVTYTSVLPAIGTPIRGVIENLTATNITITTDANANYLCVYLYTSSVDTLTLQQILDTVQIELGSTATTYEPFTPNSPSPDYPSTLEYAKEFDVMSFNVNRLNVNEIYYSVFKSGGTQDGVTIVINSDGSRSIVGTTTKANLTWHGVDMIKYLEKGKRYKHLQGEIIGNIRCSFKINRTTGTTYESNFTYDNTVLEVLPYYQVSTSGTSLNITIYPMVVEYGYTGDYIQYKGDKKSISFPFISLPDGTKNSKEYVNGVFSDVIRGKEITLTGDDVESISTGNANTIQVIFKPTVLTSKPTSINLRCNRFNVSQGSDDVEHCRFIGSVPPKLQIWLNKNRVNSDLIQDTRAWFNLNPTTVQYELATPIITPTDEIYLETYKGTTNLFTNSTPQVSMEADFKSELWSRDYLQDENDVRLDNKLNEINGYFTKYTTSPLSVLSQVELDNAINNVSSVDRQWYRLAVHVNVENLTLHGGVWYIEGFRHSSGYEWQNASTYYVGGSAKRTRAKMDSTWSAWSNILTSLDLVQSDTVSDASKPVSSVVTEALGKEIDTLNNNLVKYKYIAGMAVNSIANQHALVYDVASDVELAGKNVLGVIPSIVAGWANGEYIFSLYYNIETKKVMLTASITQTYTVSFTVLYV